MKKLTTLSGASAALMALKCPTCLLTLIGASAGLGTIPGEKSLFTIPVLILGVVFLVLLLRQWKANLVQSWILLTGFAGVGGLIAQSTMGLTGILEWVPTALLFIASLASFFLSKERANCMKESCRPRSA